MSAADQKPHTVRIKHDADSHAAGDYCHDDCTAEVICPGVTDACRTWWECGTCIDSRRDMDNEQLDEHDDLLFRDGEAHDVEHQRIDGMWMTPSDECLGGGNFDNDANDLVYKLPDGDHPVDLEPDEGFVYVIAVKTAEASR